MIKKFSKVVTKCQISNSKKLESLIFLGYLPPVNTLRKIGSAFEEEVSFPAELLYCKKSKLAQLGCIVDKEILFPYSYPYTSSTTKILRENFADLYKETKNFSLFSLELQISVIEGKDTIFTCINCSEFSGKSASNKKI